MITRASLKNNSIKSTLGVDLEFQKRGVLAGPGTLSYIDFVFACFIYFSR